MIYSGVHSKLSGRRWQRDNLGLYLAEGQELRKAKEESKGAEMAPNPLGTLLSECDGFVKDIEVRQQVSWGTQDIWGLIINESEIFSWVRLRKIPQLHEGCMEKKKKSSGGNLNFFPTDISIYKVFKGCQKENHLLLEWLMVLNSVNIFGVDFYMLLAVQKKNPFMALHSHLHKTSTYKSKILLSCYYASSWC